MQPEAEMQNMTLAKASAGFDFDYSLGEAQKLTRNYAEARGTGCVVDALEAALRALNLSK